MDNQDIDLQVGHGLPDAGDGSAASVGAALAAARAAKGWAVEDIARMLKLSVAQVNGLESGDYSRLPAPVFVRGFIRSYARLVNLELPPTPAPAPVQSVTTAPPETPDGHMLHRTRGVAIEPSPYRRVPAIAMGVACVLLGLAYYEFVFNAPHSSDPTANVPVDASQQTMTDTPAGEAASAKPAAPRPVASSSDQLVLKKSAEPSLEITGRNGLHFVFNGNSWVEVRDRAGRVVYSKSNPSGTESLVRGDPPLSVVVGAASVVKLSYNGSPVDLAMHATADVARLRLE
jgi:cytoskeleton protein RodZ